MSHDHSFQNYKDSCNRLAQDMKVLLKASLERRFVPKAGKQYRCLAETNTKPNTNTTKNSNDKSFISEPSRQTTSETKCFRGHRYGHVVARCPTMSLLIENAGVNEGNLEDYMNQRGALITHMRNLGCPI